MQTDNQTPVRVCGNVCMHLYGCWFICITSAIVTECQNGKTVNYNRSIDVRAILLEIYYCCCYCYDSYCSLNLDVNKNFGGILTLSLGIEFGWYRKEILLWVINFWLSSKMSTKILNNSRASEGIIEENAVINQSIRWQENYGEIKYGILKNKLIAKQNIEWKNYIIFCTRFTIFSDIINIETFRSYPSRKFPSYTAEIYRKVYLITYFIYFKF